MPSSISNNVKAFTLIELVIALSIMGLIMGVAYSTLGSIMRGKQTLDDGRDMRLVSSSIIGRFSRELQMSTSGMPLLPPRDNLSDRYSSRTSLLADDVPLRDGFSADRLTFLALEAGQYQGDAGSHSGIVQITYFLEENDRAPRSDYQIFSLMREETPYMRPFEDAYEKTMVFPIASNVISLRFRFYDSENEQWVENWGTEGRVNIPSVIEYSITLLSPAGNVETLTSSVALVRLN